MPENTSGPDLAQLEREGTRLHHCIATEGLGEGDTTSPGNHDRGPVKRKPPKQETGTDF